MKRLPFASIILGFSTIFGCALSKVEVTSYETCVAAGNPSLRSLPPKCIANGHTYVQGENRNEQATPPLPTPLNTPLVLSDS